jgi:teichuronic acid exporter
MSLKNKALSGLFWVTIQQFSSQIVGFLVSIILTRLLLPEEFGLIAMLSIVIGVGGALVQGGMNSSIIRTIDPDDDDYSTVFYFNLVSSIIIYVITFFLAKPISDFYDIPLLESITKCYAIVFIINAFSSIQFTRLQKEMMFKQEMKIKLPSLILSGIVGIILAYNGFGVWSLVYSALLQSFFLAIQVWLISSWRPKICFNSKKFNYHFHYGYKLTLSSLLDIVFSNSFTIIIGKFFSPAQVGFYNRAETLKQLPVNNISNILNKITFPLFAEVKEDDARLKDIYRRIMQMVLFFVAPILLIMAALGEPLFRFLFTEKWVPAVPYFQILCWAGILYPIHAYNLNILKVKGRSDLFLKLEIIKKIMVVVIITMSIPYGIYGLLYGGIITSVLAFFINTYYSGKFINYTSWHQIIDVLPTLILATITGATVHLVDKYLSQQLISDLIRLVIGTAIGTLIFLLLSKLFKLNAMNELINIIKKQ